MLTEQLARTFDHTILKPEATADDVRRVAEEVVRHDFRGLCVAGCWVELGREVLGDHPARLVSISGFPLGSSSPAAKAAEARDVVGRGADEVDMVLNVGWLKEGRHDAVRDEIGAVVEAAAGRPVKVIIETCVLTDAEKARACDLIEEAGAAFVKTSTGFHREGAQVDDVRLLVAKVQGRLKVKASAGIRTLSQSRALVEAGADVLGCSASVAILGELTAPR